MEVLQDIFGQTSAVFCSRDNEEQLLKRINGFVIIFLALQESGDAGAEFL